jgi:hypothetical protein
VSAYRHVCKLPRNNRLRALHVNVTLIQAKAVQKSYKPKEGSRNDDGTNFGWQKRSSVPHGSTTDPDARLYKENWWPRSTGSSSSAARLTTCFGCWQARLNKDPSRLASTGTTCL